MSSLKDFQVGGFHNRLKGRLDMNKTTVPPIVAEAMNLAKAYAIAHSRASMEATPETSKALVEAANTLLAYLTQLLQPTEPVDVRAFVDALDLSWLSPNFSARDLAVQAIKQWIKEGRCAHPPVQPTEPK